MKLKVSFIIEGTMLADDVPLNEENMRHGLGNFDIDSLSYWGNRDIDTVISELEIEEIKDE